MSAGSSAAAPSPVAAPRVSVVVMAFNERDNLEPTVDEIAAALDGLGGSHEILLVDDGSSDGTAELADRLAAGSARVRVIHHGKNQGLGMVYRTGFREARGELVTFYPADGQFSAAAIPRFAALLADHDMVLGYLPERDDGLLPHLLSAVEKLLYRALFGPMPRFQGVMMFRRSLLDGMELRLTGRGWGVVMELILRTVRGGHRVTSIANQVRPRRSGHSKVNNLRSVYANVAQLIELRLRF